MSDYYDDDAYQTDTQLEIQAGRRAPFSQVADWVLLADISRTAKLLYAVLCMHINSERNDRMVWPSQDVLAELLGYSSGRKIRPFLKELERIDAIRIPKPSDPDQKPADHYYYVSGLRRQKTIYIVHQLPPEGYDGHESMKQFYAARNDRIRTERRARVDAEFATPADTAGPADEGAETGHEPQGAETGPLGNPGGKPDRQGAETGPPPGGPDGSAPGVPCGPPNKTKKNQTKENQTNAGGHPAAPPHPRRTKTAGQAGNGVTTQGDFSTQQPTAREPKQPLTCDSASSGKDAGAAAPGRTSTSGKPPVVGKIVRRSGSGNGSGSSYAAARAAAAGCTRCDDAGLNPDGSPCLHDALRARPESTHSHEPARTG